MSRAETLAGERQTTITLAGQVDAYTPPVETDAIQTEAGADILDEAGEAITVE